MAKIPTTDEWVEKIAEEALDGYIYKGKTLREWVDILAQQPCEDCISRGAVNDGFKKYENGSFAYGCVWDYINKLPSVTPKEKTGKWIDEEVGFDGDIAYRCSNCNELFWVEEGTPKDNEYNFCPNCGARMEVEKNG